MINYYDVVEFCYQERLHASHKLSGCIEGDGQKIIKKIMLLMLIMPKINNSKTYIIIYVNNLKNYVFSYIYN